MMTELIQNRHHRNHDHRNHHRNHDHRNHDHRNRNRMTPAQASPQQVEAQTELTAMVMAPMGKKVKQRTANNYQPLLAANNYQPLLAAQVVTMTNALVEQIKAPALLSLEQEKAPQVEAQTVLTEQIKAPALLLIEEKKARLLRLKISNYPLKLTRKMNRKSQT